MIVDTGADITVLSQQLCRKLGIQFQQCSSPPKAVGASGNPIKIIGRIVDACIEISDRFFIDTIWVAQHLNSDAILGRSSLSAFQALTIQYGGHLSPLQVQEISSDTSKFADCNPVSCFPSIPTTPIRAPSRRHSLEDKQFMRAEVTRLLREGKIQQSNSSWRSQAFVIRENGRKPRMVIDYAQTVNRVTPLDAYPLPLASDLLDRISQYTIFSYINLKDAFHQFRLKPGEYHLTAFEADQKLWEFKTIPFGLRNSPAAFNRALNDLLDGLPGLFIYMDDIVIAGKTKLEHDTNLQLFFDRITSKHLQISKEKSVFGGSRLRFLGHIITGGTIALDPDRSAPFVNYPLPTTSKQLERFIGLAVYYAKWIPRFSQTMNPLFSALKRKELPLSAASVKAINTIKQQIKDAILYVADPLEELTITTDASAVAIGAILSQLGRPIAFMSKKLTKSQLKWSAAKLEGFAVVEACNQFRHFLANRPFRILCDQHGFVQALHPKKGTKGIKNRKFARWRLERSEFNFTIHHLPGILNTAADAFSRIASISVNAQDELVRLRHEQFGHPGANRLMQLCQQIQDGPSISNLYSVCCAVVKNCRICAEVKPHWLKGAGSHVVQASEPWE